MIATSNLFRFGVIISISFPPVGSHAGAARFHLAGDRSRKISSGPDRERSTGVVKDNSPGAVAGYLTGWSLGGGSVEPVRL